MVDIIKEIMRSKKVLRESTFFIELLTLDIDDNIKEKLFFTNKIKHEK